MIVRKMNKQKIAEQLQKLDSLAFGLRMAVTALQNEIYESVTVSSESQPEFFTGRDLGDEHSEKSTYGTVPLDKHDEVSQVEPDGFHGKSYKDFKKNQVLPEWKNALCAVKSLRAIARRQIYGTARMMALIPNVYGVRPS